MISVILFLHFALLPRRLNQPIVPAALVAACQEFPGFLESLDKQDSWEYPELGGPQEAKVMKVLKENKVHGERRATKVMLEDKVSLVHKDHKASSVLQVH